MGIQQRVEKRKTEKMPNASFRIMTLIFQVIDFFYPYIRKRVRKFGIKEGMSIVDYGCGPGRYTTKFAELVGKRGKVYALDIHELAIDAVKKKMEKYNLRNIEPVLLDGYDSMLPDDTADMVCAIDMFWIIKRPTEFLKELRRIIKQDGILVVDDGHQRRSVTKKKILNSGIWDIAEETRDHLKCKPR